MNSASKYFIYAGIFLAPFQYIAIQIYGSRYDLSLFFILIGVLLCKNGAIKLKSLAILYIFAILQCILAITFEFTPLYRVISATALVGSLIFIALNAETTNCSNRVSMNCTLYSVLPMVLYALLEGLVLSSGERPKALFDEPSTLGLYLLSVANGMYAENIFVKKKFNRTINIIFIIVLVYVAYLTQSANFISFILVFQVILFFEMKALAGIHTRSLKYYSFIALFIFALYAFFNLLGDKISLAGNNNANISLYSWLRGFDQASAAIKIAPLSGLGGGSTGQFDFDSSYTELLSKYGLQILNMNDAYSLAFRLIIEFGILFFIFFLTCITQKIVNAYHQIKKYKNISSGVMFNFFFALTLIVGCLIKEPTYSRSLIFVAIFLIFNAFKWNEK